VKGVTGKIELRASRLALSRHGLCHDRGGQPLIESGKARALAKLDGRKEPYPDAPTLAAADGRQNFEDISIWLGLVAPKATPAPIIDKLNREVVHILSQPDVREKFNQTGNFAVTSTPEEFAAFIRGEAARWEKVLKEAGIRYD
jgi:tripartite-type tricarboxylate transporter receptor subunit TctC